MKVKGRYRQVIRCLRLIESGDWRGTLLDGRLDRLAQKYGVTTRTIRRDLAAIREVGYGDAPHVEQDIPPDRVRV